MSAGFGPVACVKLASMLATSLLAACSGGGRAPRSAMAPAPSTLTPRAASVDRTAVDAAMGRASVAQSEDVHRYNMPRSDLRVTVDGVVLRPSLALGSWLAMKPVRDGVMAMGDRVLTDAEIQPVLSRLQAGGIEQTASHHHVIRESPRVLYVHVHGHGDPVAIARAVHDAIALTATPPAAAPSVAPATTFGVDTAALVRALGYSGRVTGGVYQVTVLRTEVIRDAGMVIPAVMGLGTAINFQPTGDGLGSRCVGRSAATRSMSELRRPSVGAILEDCVTPCFSRGNGFAELRRSALLRHPAVIEAQKEEHVGTRRV